MKVNVWGIFWLLGLVKSCIGSSIRPASLEKQLRDADYVFMFNVTSAARRYCLNIPLFNANVPTAKPSLASSGTPSLVTSPATPRVLSNIKTATPPLSPSTTSHGKDNRSSNDSTFALRPTARLVNQPSSSSSPSSQEVPTRNDVTSSGRVGLHPTTYPASSSGAATARKHMGPVFCIPVYHQVIRIMKKQVYKGLDDLRNISVVKAIPSRDYYESEVRLDLNFGKTLKLFEEYLYLGKRIPNGKSKDHVFMINSHTVKLRSEVKHVATKFFDV